MKKIIIALAFVLAIVVLFVMFSLSSTSTTLLGSISVDHPRYISVFEPGSPGVAEKLGRADFRMTSVLPYLQSIDTASRELLEGPDFKGYFEKLVDTVNEHNMRVVVLSPRTVPNDDIGFVVLFAARQDVLPDVTLKFEIKCMDRTDIERPEDSSTRYLKCERAKDAVNEMASSIDVFDTNALQVNLQTMADENARNLEALKQKARDASSTNR